ncbi:hypothetical protein [Fundidesulfovibrio terrae]|uniref:hypothetical protein n=1 Tax=Fundidesulfovibrio terrae TaxID=2922866 RepID=UPI001FAF37BE|nr:hypothetical protein [Fundidesulfovibrio terrae]
MDPSTLIPPADAIPAAPWLFRALLDTTFTVHLLFMNAMLGLTLLGFVRSLRPARALGQQATMVPTATALAVNIGVAPLLFLQVLYGQFLYVSSTLMAVYWFALVLAVMAAYGLAYRQKYALHKNDRRGTLLWGIMSALFLYASLTQTTNAILLVRPDLWSGYLGDPGGTLTAWGDPTFTPRWLHYVTAAVALGGLCLAMIGHGRAKRHDPSGEALKAEGLSWFGWATLIQALDGVWWLVSLPRPLMLAFMGGDHAASMLLMAGLAGTGLAVAFAFKGRLMPAAAAAVFTVAVMTAMRGVLRQLYLTPFFDPSGLPVVSEPSTTAMFLGFFAVSIAVVAWAARHPKTDPKGA